MPWPLIAAGAATVVGGVLAYKGAGDAADAQEKAAERAAEVQLEMYYQSRADLRPWQKAGEWALGSPGMSAEDATQNALMPLTEQKADLENQIAKLRQGTPTYGDVGHGNYWNKPGGFLENQGQPYSTSKEVTGYRKDPESFEQINQLENQLAQINQQIETGSGDVEGTGLAGMIERGPGEFEESPGYQFTLSEGLKGQQNALSAMGRNRSGAHIKAATQYATDMASTEYDNFLARWYRSLTPYQSMAGMGMTTGQQGSLASSAAGRGVGASYIAGGDARASGDVNQANLLSSTLTSGANQLLGYNALRNLPQQGYQPYQAGTPNYSGQAVDQWQYQY